MDCRFCGALCHKKGLRHGSQQYRCTGCLKYQKNYYRYRAYEVDNATIASFVKEGLGIRSSARLLKINPSTVISRIKRIALQTEKPAFVRNRSFEVDELSTFIGSKSKVIWIVLTMDRSTRKIVDFYVGPRTLRSLRMVTNTLLLSNPNKICTDGLLHYRSLLPQEVHDMSRYATNRIERMNLSLRTHLKRLNRRSICYSKSLTMLISCLTIYFWS